MNPKSHPTKTLARGISFLFGAIALTVAIAAGPPVHLRGTIVSATPNSLTVRTVEGDVSVALDSATRISGIVPSSLGQIKAGTFVGIANVPAIGASSALEVVVFPDAMKGSGLGDYPWDLPSAATHGSARTSAMTNGTVKSSAAANEMATTSAMTNGTVKSSAPAIGIGTTSAMTNGTVKNTSNANGLVLVVDYGKGEKTIHVPPGVPVVGIVPADSSKLLPGAHVFVATKKDEPRSAAFISVGIDGTVPPM